MRRLLWRAIYGVLEREATVRLAAWAAGALAARRGELAGDALLRRIAGSLSLGGWPPRNGAWANLHGSRFYWRAERRWRGRPPRAKRVPRELRPGQPLRVGVFGAFSGALSFPRALFEAWPEEHELHVVDLQYKGALADYLKEVATTYTPILSGPAGYDLDRGARALEAADIDLLLVIHHKREAYDLLDRVDAPFIMAICTGSDVLHHSHVDLNLYVQPEADSFPHGDRLFCGTTGRPFPHARVASGFLHMDRRGVSISAHPPWTEREPLMVFHGSLYKLASLPFLHTLCALLAEDRSRRFAFMGKDDGASLRVIMEAFKAGGVASQVSYEGVFSAVRGPDGLIHDPGWERLLALLGRARLAPDPWPVGGASARFEAYIRGVPTVHLGVRFDRDAWGRAQPALLEVPYLNVAAAVARSPEEYIALARRCLHDQAYAQAVVDAQLDVARRLTDSKAYWNQVLDAYHAARAVIR